MKRFAFFFAVQCLNYAMLTWNYRVVAQARYVSIFASDLCCAAITFGLIKKIVDERSKSAMAGYVLGGACGSVFAAWITKAIYGQ